MAAPPIAERHKPHFHRRAPVKESCRAATTANITISTALNNGDTLDGITLATGDRVLVKDQSTASQNGIYLVGASPAREYDESTDDPSFGYLVFVREGTANASTLWVNTNTSTPTIGSTSLTFQQITTSTSTSSGADFDSDLFPISTITTTKDSGNPTFNFNAVPESVVKVGSTYYCVYQGNWGGTWDVRLATASDRDGPWTALSTIYTIGDVAWAAGSTSIYAPSLTEDAGTFYLFYSIAKTAGTTDAGNGIGVATASSITGPYTDHGSAVLSPGAGTTWDSRRVGEQDVIHHDGRWLMAYMGESSALAYQASEKIGTATAAAPTGPWTKSTSNPVIGFGSAGGWDDALIADPCIVFENGYYWIMYVGAPDAGPSTSAAQGLAYALDPTGPFTRYGGNPILSPGTGWESTWVFRGCLFLEDGLWGGVYAGYDGANMKGGNFRLVVALSSITSTSTSPATDHEHVLNVCFNGDGSTTSWILPAAPVDSTSVAAYVGGSRSVDFTLSGTILDTITFGSAPGAGTNNVVIDIEAAVA